MEKFWNHDIEELYNCSKYSFDEWKALGKPNWLIGVVYIVSGIVYELLYVPILIIMLRPKFLQRSCYKIMFFLGLIDVACIVLNSLVCGYLSITGDLFCTSPKLIYIVGCIATGLWAANCLTCVLLGLNRCIALVDPTLARNVFGGNKTYLWLILPTVYAIFFILFTNPLLFTSRYYAMFFNPNIRIPGFDDVDEERRHPHIAHTMNNVSEILILSCVYITLCIILVKNRGPHSHINRLQQQTFLQSSIICGINATAAVIYVIMQFLPTPTWLVVTGQITWQASHGGAVLIYLFMNRSLRNAALLLIKPGKVIQSSRIKKRIIRRPTLSYISEQKITTSEEGGRILHGKCFSTPQPTDTLTN